MRSWGFRGKQLRRIPHCDPPNGHGLTLDDPGIHMNDGVDPDFRSGLDHGPIEDTGARGHERFRTDLAPAQVGTWPHEDMVTNRRRLATGPPNQGALHDDTPASDPDRPTLGG